MCKTVKTGDLIWLHYTGMFEDGTIIFSTFNTEPILVKVGVDDMIKGLEKAVLDMQPGERKKVAVKPVEAHGEYDKNLIVEKPKEMLNKHISPEKGMKVMLVSRNGESMPSVITEVKEDSIVVDGNHSFAGKTLVFDLKVVEIVKGFAEDKC